jgi:hypothetical protein
VTVSNTDAIMTVSITEFPPQIGEIPLGLGLLRSKTEGKKMDTKFPLRLIYMFINEIRRERERGKYGWLTSFM